MPFLFCIYLATPLTAILVERSAEDSAAIRGVTSIGDRLYVLHMRQDDQLSELDARDLRLQRRLSVPAEWRDEWRHLSDMASCQRRRRLYVSHNVTNCVHVRELTADDEAWSTWKTDGSPWGLSVTPDTGNVLVTLRYAGCVDEYAPDGRRLRRVDLSRSGAFSPWHAIQLGSLPFDAELLVVGHGDIMDERARVGLMRVLGDGGTDGRRWYGGRPGGGEQLLSRPQHLAVGRYGTVAVVDVFNDRVVLLDDELRRVAVVAGPECDRAAGWLTSRTCWVGRRLCVAEVQSPDHLRFTAARLSLYDLH